MKKMNILAVAGPTASGKTALAVALAQRCGGEVISNDSMQLYRGMVIGTAAPTPAEQQGIFHHMIGVMEPDHAFSCADYGEAAAQIAREIHARGKLPIFCGGTGLYLDAALYGDGFSNSGKNEKIRLHLTKEAEEYGVGALHKRLAAIDPEAAAAIHENNVRRVIRALEIYETTGVTKTEWDRKSRREGARFDAKIIVLSFLSRALLYSRIDRRVELMFDAGLPQEAEQLWRSGLLRKDLPSGQAIGYKEFLPYFRAEATLDEVKTAIQTGSRHYAKRQITWFKRYSDALIVHPDGEDGIMRAPEELAEEVLRRLGERDGT